MLFGWLVATVLAGDFEVDASRSQPLVTTLPAPGLVVHYDLRDTAELGSWGAESYTRSVVEIRVQADGKGRSLTSTDQMVQRVVQTDFGLAEPEQLAQMPRQGPGLAWTLDKNGAVTQAMPLDADGPQGALFAAMLSSAAFPVPPKKIRPGETWSVQQDLRVPMQLDEGREAAFLLSVAADNRFEGWTQHEGRWLARLAIDAVIELSGVLRSPDRSTSAGGVARVSSIVILDPEDGLPVWSSRRTRVVLAVGRHDDRPTVVQSVQVLER